MVRRSGRNRLGFTGLVLVSVVVAFFPRVPLSAQDDIRVQTTVGMTGKLDAVVLPGPELEPKPIADRKLPVILRIVQVYAHGTDFRYDFEYYGLEPGTFDLRDYLKRKDGQPLAGVPPLKVKVNAVLPPGQVEPHKQTIDPGPKVGGYRTLVIAFFVVWGLGLLIILAWFLRPFFVRKALGVSIKPQSLADRLKPLVEGALAGKLSQAQLAELERALFAFWRKRLKLERAEPSQAIAAMRADAKAGPLLAELEDWLHRPGPARPADVGQLLAPYRELPADAVDLPSGGGA